MLSLLLLGTSSVVEGKKAKKGSALPTLKKEQFREAIGVRTSKRVVAECGVLVYLMAPIVTADEAQQRSEQDAQRKMMKILKDVSRKVPSDEVLVAKFPFAANKIFLLSHTTVEASWSGSLAFAVTPPKKSRKTFERRGEPLVVEKLDDSSPQGIARFIDSRCGTSLAGHDEV